MKKVLVTGGTGFIGSFLVDRLLKKGIYVKVLALRSPIEKIEKVNESYLREKGAEIVFGDLRDKSSLTDAISGVDVVFHLGAISRPMNIEKKLYYDINGGGTRNLLELVRDSNIKKFIHVSTVSVLGLSPDGHPLKEDEFQEESADYGLSKRVGEKIALKYHEKYGIPVVVIRPCLIYGPRCLPRLVMFRFVKKCLFPILKGGRAKMEFCYVENLVDAILLAESIKKIEGEVFNVTDGNSYSIRKVLNTIADELKVCRSWIRIPVFVAKFLGLGTEILSKLVGIHPPFSRTAADWMSRDLNVYDCRKAKKKLGYKPRISLKEGVKRSIVWYKKNNYL